MTIPIAPLTLNEPARLLEIESKLVSADMALNRYHVLAPAKDVLSTFYYGASPLSSLILMLPDRLASEIVLVVDAMQYDSCCKTDTKYFTEFLDAASLRGHGAI
jgi:hypothetical protein